MNKKEVIKCSIRRWVQYCLDDNITAYAAQASFFILISAIPLVMLVISLLQYLLPSQDMIISQVISQIMPEASGLRTFVLDILDEVYNSSTGAIVSFSVIAILWSASKGVYALQDGLNQLGRIKTSENYLIRRIKAIGYTLIFIGIILFAVVFIMCGELLRDLAAAWFPNITYLSALITLLRSVVAFELFLHFFILLYATLPGGKSYFTNKIPSAVFTSVGWMIFSYIYAFYLNHIAVNSYIYGSLSALIFLMLWLYFCMVIFFVGAELDKIILTRSKNKKFMVRIAYDVMLEACGEEYLYTIGWQNTDVEFYPAGYKSWNSKLPEESEPAVKAGIEQAPKLEAEESPEQASGSETKAKPVQSPEPETKEEAGKALEPEAEEETGSCAGSGTGKTGR